MRKFTSTEIDLCKKIAEKERMQINKGDWIIEIDRADIPLLVIDIQLEYLTLSLGYESTHRVLSKRKEVVPLWQEHDCLEWLREKGYRVMTDEDLTESDPFKAKCYGHGGKRAYYRYGKTPLEALLRAVLAVMEEATG